MPLYMILLIAVIAIASIGGLGIALSILSRDGTLRDRVASLETESATLRGDIEKLAGEITELRNRRHHPYPTAAGLEDAIAILMDYIQEDEASQAYRRTRINQLFSTLKVVRGNPHGYDADRPNGKGAANK